MWEISLSAYVSIFHISRIFKNVIRGNICFKNRSVGESKDMLRRAEVGLCLLLTSGSNAAQKVTCLQDMVLERMQLPLSPDTPLPLYPFTLSFRMQHQG